MGNRCLTDYLMACGMLKWYMHLLSWVICGMGVLFGLRIMRTGVSNRLCFGVDAEDAFASVSSSETAGSVLRSLNYIRPWFGSYLPYGYLSCRNSWKPSSECVCWLLDVPTGETDASERAGKCPILFCPDEH